MLKIKSCDTFNLLYKMLFNNVKAGLDEKARHNLNCELWSEMCELLDLNHALMSHVKDANIDDCNGIAGMHLAKLRRVDEYYKTVSGFRFDIKTIYEIMR